MTHNVRVTDLKRPTPSKKSSGNPSIDDFSFKDIFTIFGGFSYKPSSGDFPAGPLAKNPPANAGDIGSIPDLGRLHMPRSK